MNPFTNVKLVEPEKTEASKDGNFNSILIGAGDDAFHSDRQGIWLGANYFEDADFSVSMQGIVNVIDGIITGGTIQTATEGARIVISGNDIVLYDDTTGGSIPVSGDTASLLFKRTDEKNGDFLIQKRASANNDSGNVMEMFFNEDSVAEYNYLFLGRKGEDANVPSNWNTDVISVGASGFMQFGVADKTDANSVPAINIMTGVYWNDNIGAGTPTNPYVKKDAVALSFAGVKGVIDPSLSGTIDTGGIAFGILESKATGANVKTMLNLDYDTGAYMEKLIMLSLNGATPSITLNSRTITSWNDIETDLSSVGESILPSTDSAYNLGSDTKTWQYLYIETFYNGSSLCMSFEADASYVSFYRSIDMNVHDIIDVNDMDINGNVDINEYLSVHGVLFMNSQQIRDVANPTAAQHAATKKYVDDRETAIKAWVTANFVAS